MDLMLLTVKIIYSLMLLTVYCLSLRELKLNLKQNSPFLLRILAKLLNC